MRGLLPEPGCQLAATGCIRNGYAASLSRNGVQSAQSGVKSATYRIEGFFREHGNLNLSAEKAELGKPSSPAMSQVRGGVFVVVRARESRVHGEGRQ